MEKSNEVLNGQYLDLKKYTDIDHMICGNDVFWSSYGN